MSSRLKFAVFHASLLIVAIGCAMFVSGCDGKRTTTKALTGGKITVAATIFPLAAWAGSVGGDLVTTVTLLPAGKSPHVFEPGPADMRRLSTARVLFKAGLRLDDWAATLAGAAPGVEVVSLGDYLKDSGKLPKVPEIEESSPESTHNHEEGVNPHFWLDPQIAQHAVAEIARQLSKIDPPNAATYRRNAEEYSSQLHRLDEELSASLAPCRSKAFVTFHSAFAYFANRYDLRIAAVLEEYPGKVPSDRYVRHVVDTLRRLNIRTVFAEPQLSPKLADIIATEVNGRVDTLDPSGDSSYPDRNTYEKLLRYDADKIRRALSEQ